MLIYFLIINILLKKGQNDLINHLYDLFFQWIII